MVDFNEFKKLEESKAPPRPQVKLEWSKYAQEVFEKHNQIRTNPQLLIPRLEAAIERFKDKILMSEDGKSGVETLEGKEAYLEAIAFLQKQRPVPALKWASELAMAAQDHVNDVGPKGIMSSIGSDGSMPQDRIARYCCIDEAWAESLCFGATTADEVMERMIVDDG